MANSLFDQFLSQLKSNLSDIELITNSPPDAALTIPAKNPETGDIKVWDDGVELTVGIGKIFHCHFDSTVFFHDNVSKEKAEEKCIDSAVAFIEDFLAERTILYIRYSDGKPGMSGIVNRQNVEATPKNTRMFVWSGPIE